MIYFRFDSTLYWKSDTKENCILSNDVFTRTGGTEGNLIVNDKDWDFYLYDELDERCQKRRDRVPSRKGNSRSSICYVL